MPIHKLDPTLVNQIAAGEVIERPASVVKESLENAIDAGAGIIDMLVENGGRDLIRIRDNGCGIAAEELPLAVASHATSKLQQAADLFRVNTLGFRGEALASIAAVSQLRLRSRPDDQVDGAEIEVSGGAAGPVRAWGGPAGTTVEVRNLFFNTPARRKFLRTTQTEVSHIVEAFTRIALAYPAVQLSLRHNDRKVHELPATDRWIERLALFFGPELAENLIWVESQDGATRLWGYVASPQHSRPNGRWQYVFLNGRSIRDRSLSHALGEAYRGLLMTGRYPIAFLCLEMPPELVDVNVHPTKLEVRFQESGRLYNQLLATLRNRFLTSDLTARLKPVPAAPTAIDASAPDQSDLRRRIADWATDQLVDRIESSASTGAPSGTEPVGGFPFEITEVGGGTRPACPGEPLDDSAAQNSAERFEIRAGRGDTKALQLHNSYLVAETSDGMVVIDQHALHERILYERLRTRISEQSTESQRLLVPEVVDLTPAEASAVLQQRALLAQLGMEVEGFGGASVLVKSYPAMLTNLAPQQMLRDLVDQLQAKNRSPEARDLLDELLHMIACKAAIKAGQRLTPEEMSALLEQRHLAHDTHHCPHGRPTALVFTKAELEKQFKRT